MNKRTVILGVVTLLVLVAAAGWYFQDDLPFDLPWNEPKAPAVAAKPQAPKPAPQAAAAPKPAAEAPKPAAAPAPDPKDPVAMDNAIKATQAKAAELEKKVAELQKQVDAKNKEVAEMEKKVGAKPAASK